MGQPTTPPAAFNPVPHCVGLLALSLANPLIYHSSEPLAVWFTSFFGVILLVALIFGGYRLLAPARAKAAGLRPFILLAWVVLALSVLKTWTDAATTNKAMPAPQVAAQNDANSHGLKPFNGTLDQENKLVPFNGKLD